MSINSKTKNVKLPVALVDSVYKRKPDTPAGTTLMEIYTEYEYLETVARRVAGVNDTEPIKISEAIEKFFEKTLNELDELRKAHDEYKTMLQGLNLFFAKVKK